MPTSTRVVEEVSGALATAHAVGVVHRDVKPANVLFDDAGNSYLADFGIAVLDDASDDDGLDLRSAGSPLYASPEQAARFGVVAGVGPVRARGRSVGGAHGTGTVRGIDGHRGAAGEARRRGAGASRRRRRAIGARRRAPASDCAASVGPLSRRHRVRRGLARRVIAADDGEAVRTTGDLDLEPATRAAAVDASPACPRSRVNPYKGLRAFREADAAEFHGRDELVDRLVDSGQRRRRSSRSSDHPVRARARSCTPGLVPELRRRGALVVSMVPGIEPLRRVRGRAAAGRHGGRR